MVPFSHQHVGRTSPYGGKEIDGFPGRPVPAMKNYYYERRMGYADDEQ